MMFGSIDSLLLFGGGPRLLNLLSVAPDFKVTVVSAPRLLEAPLETGETVEAALRRLNIPLLNVVDLSEFAL
ncbi:MAG: hypothetical protein Q7S89_01610, partial [bacterium]|nr:hypothetical protein [bacterium]